MKIRWLRWLAVALLACAMMIASVQLLLYRGDWSAWVVNATILVVLAVAPSMRPAHELEPPSPPVNVRLIYPDGAETPLECRYEGRDGEGLHLWVAVAAAPLVPGMRLTADQVPAHTKLTVEGQEGEG